jgi:hypothetical protein
MSDTSLKKLLIPALLTTGAVFTALAAPVVMFSGEKLQIQQNGEVTFDGTVREAAVPYLGLASLASVGLGISSVALQGWRKTAKKSQQLDDRLTDLQQRLEERETHLQAALTSDYYLERSGLNFFLDDTELPVESFLMAEAVPAMPAFAPPAFVAATPLARTGLGPSATEQLANRLAFDTELAELESCLTKAKAQSSQPVSQPVSLPGSQPTSQPVSQRETSAPDKNNVPIPLRRSTDRSPNNHRGYQVSTTIESILTSPQPATAPALQVQTAVSPLTVAQGFLSFNRTTSTQQPSPVSQPATTPSDDLTIAKIQALQTQLQQIVTQIESLQTNLVPETVVAEPEVNHQFGQERHHGLVPQPQRTMAAETIWTSHRAAS